MSGDQEVAAWGEFKKSQDNEDARNFVIFLSESILNVEYLVGFQSACARAQYTAGVLSGHLQGIWR